MLEYNAKICKSLGGWSYWNGNNKGGGTGGGAKTKMVAVYKCVNVMNEFIPKTITINGEVFTAKEAVDKFIPKNTYWYSQVSNLLK